MSEAIKYFDSAKIKYDDRGDYTGAIADYDKAIELDPNYAQPTQPRLAKAEIKQYTEAIADYDKALELDPNLHQPTRTEASQN